MKPIFKLTLGIILVLCFSELKGQTDFRPGYVITNQNDTLRGLIDYRGAARNAKRCDFKESLESAVKEYKPNDIKGYRYVDSKFYVSKEMGKGIYLFLEFVLNGIADLYYYYDGEYSHYYIEKRDGQMFELTEEQEVIKKGDKTYVRDKKNYIGFLKYAFADCPQVQPMVNNTSLEMKSLVNVTKKYHDYVCNGEECIIYEKRLPGIKLSLLPFISLNFSSLQFEDLKRHIPWYEFIKFNNAVYPTIGLKIKATLPRASEKLTLQLSGEYGKSSYYGSGSYFYDDANPNNSIFQEVHIKLSSLKGRAGIKYTWPTGIIRPNFTIGGNALILINKDIERTRKETGNSTVYTYRNDDLFAKNPSSGYSLEIGADYHQSLKFVPFINLGFDRSRVIGGTVYGRYKIIFQTFHIDAGINF